MPAVPKKTTKPNKELTKALNVLIGDKKPTLADKIAKVPQRKSSPLWTGPCGESDLGGVTQSMLGRYLSCPERFRIYAVEGLQPADSFSAPLEFGNMWHVCEEAVASDDQTCINRSANVLWKADLTDYCIKLYNQHPMNREKVDHWYSMCKAMFPLYFSHWAEHDDMKQRVPLMSEQVFNVPYKLPSGRVVRLRGKFDSVDLVEGGDNAGVWLMENKTKSSIDKQKLQRQLTFDLQTMLYLIALKDIQIQSRDNPGAAKHKGGSELQPLYGKCIRGVRYNVVRRSAHKSTESMLKKLTEDQAAGRIEEWFARWNVGVQQRDIDKFKRECLDPVLENLCDDYEWWAACKHGGKVDVYDYQRREMSFVDHKLRHFRFPYGVYSPVAEGGFGDVDAYMDTGSTAGLRRAETLFPELQ